MPGSATASGACPEPTRTRYFAEFAAVARALDADPVPESRAEAEALIAAMRPELAAEARTREVARKVLEKPAPLFVVAPVQAVVMHADSDEAAPSFREDRAP